MTLRKIVDKQKRRRQAGKRRDRLQKVRQHEDHMLERLETTGLGKYKVIETPTGATRMSELLLDFIAPYQDMAHTEDEMHRLVTIALIAWNTSLILEENRQEALAESVQSLPPDLVEDFYAVIEELMERKQKYFADYTRPIVDYELIDLGEGDYHLSVVSLIDPE